MNFLKIKETYINIETIRKLSCEPYAHDDCACIVIEYKDASKTDRITIPKSDKDRYLSEFEEMIKPKVNKITTNRTTIIKRKTKLSHDAAPFIKQRKKLRDIALENEIKNRERLQE